MSDREAAHAEAAGFAHDSVVRDNRIRGHARAGVAVRVFKAGVLADSVLIKNRFDDFRPSLADIVAESGVRRTRIEGPGTVRDQERERSFTRGEAYESRVDSRRASPNGDTTISQ
ncbi:MAG: hypothetical protein NVS4B3_20150 [Gemmatimonadaceae bacterium]